MGINDSPPTPPSATSKHIPELDGVRGLAILVVTVYRFKALTQQLLRRSDETLSVIDEEKPEREPVRVATPDDLQDFVSEIEEYGENGLRLKWEGQDTIWLLVDQTEYVTGSVGMVDLEDADDKLDSNATTSSKSPDSRLT